jgi:hypothetical protein
MVRVKIEVVCGDSLVHLERHQREPGYALLPNPLLFVFPLGKVDKFAVAQSTLVM